MASLFKYFNKSDLAAFGADTQITESLEVMNYWLFPCLLNKSSSRGCELQRVLLQQETQGRIF